MNIETIAEEIREEIEEDNFDTLEDKMEAVELLERFETSSSTRPCSLCDYGNLMDECTGEYVQKCGHCRGLGFLPY